MRGRSAGEQIETRLLVLASRPLATPTDIADIHELLAQPIDWTTLVSSAMRHGVTAQAFARLLEVAESELPADVAHASRAHIDHLRAHNRELIGELLAIVDALKAASIDVIPLKGPLLAHLVYGDATIRACRDLDILVRQADVERALDVLNELAYRPYSEKPDLTPRQEAALSALTGQAVLWRPGARAAIEPHWDLVPGNLRLAIDYDGIWQRSRLISFQGRQIRVLAPEDLVLGIAIHGGKDQWSKLQIVADLARAIDRLSALDWSLVLARAERERCRRILLTGMRLVERLMGLTLPSAITAACADDHRGVDALAEAAANQILTDGPTAKSIFEVSAFRFRLHDRWWDRIRYVGTTMLTPREHHFGLVKLPDHLFFLYYPIKVVHDYALLPMWLILKRARAIDAALTPDLPLFPSASPGREERKDPSASPEREERKGPAQREGEGVRVRPAH